MEHPLDLLTGPLYAIVRDLPSVLAPLTTIEPATRARHLLVWTAPKPRSLHLESLAQQAGPRSVALDIEATDWRAKEELLRAGAHQGATQLDVDCDLALTPTSRLRLAQALSFVTSHARATACL